MSPAKKRKVLTVVLWQNPQTQQLLVLLLRLAPNRGAFWQPVTGGVEAGEDFPAAALREAKEESGLPFAEETLRYLGLEYEFEGRWGPAIERAFAIQVIASIEPPQPILSDEHEAYQWCSPEAALKLAHHASNQKAIERALQVPSPLYLNKNGDWFQDDEQITHQKTVALLHEHLIQKSVGKYVVRVSQEELPVKLEDVARFITHVDQAAGKVRLLSGWWVTIDPASLSVGQENILYGIVELPEQGKEQAKFLRSAYYELSKNITEVKNNLGNTQYVLNFLGQNYPIAISH